MAEFALSATLLFTMIFGILDFERAMYDYNVVANAARLGIRYMIVPGADSTKVEKYVNDQLAGIGTVAITVPNPTPTTGTTCYTSTSTLVQTSCNMKVKAQFIFNFVAVPLLGSFGPITMTSTSQMPPSK
jgi:Flp pilus assembly protein TadG